MTSDPVGYGFAASLSHPGGNITGVTVDAGLEIIEKFLEILREVNLSASKISFLAPTDAWGIISHVYFWQRQVEPEFRCSDLHCRALFKGKNIDV
jgi:hypothetical protein